MSEEELRRIGKKLLKDEKFGVESLVESVKVENEKLKELLEIRDDVTKHWRVGHWGPETIMGYARQIQIIRELFPRFLEFTEKIKRTSEGTGLSTYNPKRDNYLEFGEGVLETTKKLLSAYNELVRLNRQGNDERTESFDRMLS